MKKIQILNNQNKIQSEISNRINCVNECQEFSIRMAFNGNEHYEIGNKQFNISPGSFLVINDGTVFNREILSDTPVNTLSILYTRQFLSSFHQSVTRADHVLIDDPFNVSNNSTPEFLETLYPFKGDMLFNLMHLKNLFYSENYDDLLMSEYLYHCLFNFYRIFHREVIEKSEQLKVAKSNTRNELFKRLNSAKDYILSNYNQDITLDALCKYACLSETHFFRNFRQIFYCSPHQYLLQVRLFQAKHMLKNTNYEINEIASQVGFDCGGSFIRLFRGRFGITPGNYRFGNAA